MNLFFLLPVLLSLVFSLFFLSGVVGGFLYLVRRMRSKMIERSGEEVGYAKLADEVDVLRMQNTMLSERLQRMEDGLQLASPDSATDPLLGRAHAEEHTTED